MSRTSGRALAATGMAILPPVALLALLARAEQSWRECYYETPFGYAATLKSQVTLLNVALALTPFAVLAALWLRRTRKTRTFLIWAALATLCLATLLPVEGLHHCDRKGMQGGWLVLLLLPLGLLAIGMALWNTKHEAAT